MLTNISFTKKNEMSIKLQFSETENTICCLKMFLTIKLLQYTVVHFE